MVVSYCLIGICLVVVVIFQIVIVTKTRKKRTLYANLFCNEPDKEWKIIGDLQTHKIQIMSKTRAVGKQELDNLHAQQEQLESEISAEKKKCNDLSATTSPKLISLQKQLNEVNNKIKYIEFQVANDSQDIIIDFINAYLSNDNNAISDFNLIHDTICRNTDVFEQDLRVRQYMPLYVGLLGTIVVFLVFLGMNMFLNTTQMTALVFFLLIVACCFSLILGIISTMVILISNADAKAEVEKKKQKFIIYLQENLLPKMSADFSDTMLQTGRNLINFNNSFFGNTQLLSQTISNLRSVTQKQVELYQLLTQLDFNTIATASISMYKDMRDCSTDVTALTGQLHEIEQSIGRLSGTIRSNIDSCNTLHESVSAAAARVDLAIQNGGRELSDATSVIFKKYQGLIEAVYLDVQNTLREMSDNCRKQLRSPNNIVSP